MRWSSVNESGFSLTLFRKSKLQWLIQDSWSWRFIWWRQTDQLLAELPEANSANLWHISSSNIEVTCIAEIELENVKDVRLSSLLSEQGFKSRPVTWVTPDSTFTDCTSCTGQMRRNTRYFNIKKKTLLFYIYEGRLKIC